MYAYMMILRIFKYLLHVLQSVSVYLKKNRFSEKPGNGLASPRLHRLHLESRGADVIEQADATPGFPGNAHRSPMVNQQIGKLAPLFRGHLLHKVLFYLLRVDILC